MDNTVEDLLNSLPNEAIPLDQRNDYIETYGKQAWNDALR